MFGGCYPWQCFLCSHSQVGNEAMARLGMQPQFGNASMAMLGMKPCPGWEWHHNQAGSEPWPGCHVSLEVPLDKVGCVGHLQAGASKDIYLCFPKESSPMLLGSGGPQLDVLLESSPQGRAGQAMVGLGVPFPAPSSVGRAVHTSWCGHDSAEAPFRRFPWKPDSQHEEGAFQRELQRLW